MRFGIECLAHSGKRIVSSRVSRKRKNKPKREMGNERRKTKDDSRCSCRRVTPDRGIPARRNDREEGGESPAAGPAGKFAGDFDGAEKIGFRDFSLHGA